MRQQRNGGDQPALLTHPAEFRILGINDEIDVEGLEELYERGINAIWTVEPAGK